MNPFSKQNPLDALQQIQQMGEHLRKTFGDDFMSKLFSGGVNGIPVHPMNPYQGNDKGESAAGNAGSFWDWNPFAAGSQMIPAMPQFGSGFTMFPRIDLYDGETELTLIAEIPGLVRPQDVQVFVEPRTLEISGQITSSYSAIKREHFSVAERHHGRFERSLELPQPIKTRGVAAKYRNGLLEILMPKGMGASSASKLGGRRAVPVQMA